MPEFLDPLKTYGLLFLGLAVLSLIAGVYAGRILGTVLSVIFLLLLGFVAGQYVKSTHGEWVGFLVGTGFLAAIISFFLPLDLLTDLAIYVVGYIIGMRVHRR